MSNVEKYLYSLILVIFLIIVIASITSCTISFQNIHTEGVASDLVDENQTASPDVTTSIKIPLSSIK